MFTSIFYILIRYKCNCWHWILCCMLTDFKLLCRMVSIDISLTGRGVQIKTTKYHKDRDVVTMTRVFIISLNSWFLNRKRSVTLIHICQANISQHDSTYQSPLRCKLLPRMLCLKSMQQYLEELNDYND